MHCPAKPSTFDHGVRRGITLLLVVIVTINWDTHASDHAV